MSRGKTTAIPGIYQTADGWHIKIAARINGQKVYRKRNFQGTLAEAAATQTQMRTELANELERKRLTGTGEDTFEAFANAWIDYLKSTEIKPSTVIYYQETLKTHILPYWASVRIGRITSKSVSDWLVLMSKTKSQQYARKTLHSAWRTFRACVRWICVQASMTSPVEYIKFNAKGKEEKIKETLTREELSDIVAHIDAASEPYATAILLAATTGARIGEITALRWQDIDLERGIIIIRRSNTKGIITETTKTKQIRTVPLAPIAQQRLEKMPRNGSDLLFLSRQGTYLSAGNFKGPLLAIRKAAEITKHISPHTFRRAVNDLLRQSAGNVVAQAILGHTSPQMTMHYATVGHAEAREAMKKVGALAGCPPDQSDTSATAEEAESEVNSRG